MCVKERAGEAIVVNCGDARCVEQSLAALALRRPRARVRRVVQRYWRARGFNPNATAEELADARRAKARA